VAFAGAGEQQLYALYSGDSRYDEVVSPAVRLAVARSAARLELSTVLPAAGVWNDAEPGTVRWSTVATTPAAVRGPVEVWTSEGQQAQCPTGPAGSCEVRFAAAASSAWVEVRFAGDPAYLPAVRRQVLAVRACHDVRAVADGRVLTAPSCGGTKYLAGTSVALEAPVRTGFTFLGWATEQTPGTVLQPSPLGVGRDLVAEPRYAPVCVTLRVTSYPASLRPVSPFPAPNCDDAVAPDFTERDVAAIVRTEVAQGWMRYRVGTRVQLPVYSERLTPTLLGPVRWSGQGVSAEGVLTARDDVELVRRLEPPCRAFVVDGPPGASARIAQSTFDTSVNPLLDRNVGGGCERADGTRGYLPGTALLLALTPAPGTWFERWGALEALSTHVAPAAPGVAADRPADITRVGRTVTRRSWSRTATWRCRLHQRRHLPPARRHRHGRRVAGQLRVGDKPASVSTTAANCPSWWLS
jgi:hypothetical protein